MNEIAEGSGLARSNLNVITDVELWSDLAGVRKESAPKSISLLSVMCCSNTSEFEPHLKCVYFLILEFVSSSSLHLISYVVASIVFKVAIISILGQFATMS